MFEDVGKPRIGVFGRAVALFVKRRECARRVGSGCAPLERTVRHGQSGKAGLGIRGFRRLSARFEKVLHRKPPADRLLGDFGRKCGSVRAARQKFGRFLHVADRGRKPHAARIDAREPGKPLDQAERLRAAVAAHERVDLVDHDEAQVAEKPHEVAVLSDEQRFERFGRDLEHAARALQKLLLARVRHVAVPGPDGNAARFGHGCETLELVVDERLQGRDVKRAHRIGRLFGEKRQNRKERRFGFPGGGRSAKQKMRVRVEEDVARRNLNGAQRVPAVLVDDVLNEGRVAIEYVHG